MRIFSRRRGSAALAVLLTAAAATVAVTFGATRAPADTGAACAAAYSVGWQTPSNSPPDFGATVTVTNNSSYTISTWTMTLSVQRGPDAGGRVGVQRQRDEQRRDADRDAGRDVQRRADSGAEHHLGL